MQKEVSVGLAEKGKSSIKIETKEPNTSAQKHGLEQTVDLGPLVEILITGPTRPKGLGTYLETG